MASLREAVSSERVNRTARSITGDLASRNRWVRLFQPPRSGRGRFRAGRCRAPALRPVQSFGPCSSARPEPESYEGHGCESDRAQRPRRGRAWVFTTPEGGQMRSRHRGGGPFDVHPLTGFSVGRPLRCSWPLQCRAGLLGIPADPSTVMAPASSGCRAVSAIRGPRPPHRETVALPPAEPWSPMV